MTRLAQRAEPMGQSRVRSITRRAMLSLLCVMVIAMLSGCWDAVPIEARSMATGLAIDVPESGPGEMVLTSLLLSPAKEAQDRSFTVAGVGISVSDSREDRQRLVATRILFGQLQVLLISEETAKTGFDDVLDYFIRYARISHTIHVAVCQGKASDFLKLKGTEHYDMGTHMEELISKATHTIPLPAVTLHEFLYNVITPHQRAVLPYVTIEQGKPALSGLALFRGCGLVGIIKDEDASVLTELRYSDVYGSHPFEYQTQKGAFVATMEGSMSRKVNANYDNGHWSFNITLNFRGTLMDKSPRDGLKDPEEAQILLESTLEQHLEHQANAMVERLQTELKLDALDLAKYALAKGRKRLEGTDWDEQFSKAEIKVDVKVNMATLGEGM